MIAATLDPAGRRVELHDSAWEHIERRHPILGTRLREIMAAVRQPAHHLVLRDRSEVWYLAEDAGRFRWVHVVVHYEGDLGWIVTAFPRSTLPR